jgi:phosphonate metabolism protein (transferase hexapeptide repeat family)
MMPELSETPFVHAGCQIAESTIGRFTEIGQGTRLNNVDFGDYAYTDRFCDIANARIGKFANIASLVRIGATDHPLELASLHHFMYRTSYYWHDLADDAAVFERRAARRTVIGHDTWIGHAAMIKPDVTVGDGAVVAAGAIVTRDVAPYTIVAGNPARLLRNRQPPAIAERLIALAWWDWPHDRLRDALEDFRGLEAAAFLEKYRG